MLPEVSEKATRDAAKRAEIKKAAFKDSTHAHYVVGPQLFYSKGKLYQAGEIVRLPLDQEPSITFRPASTKGVAAVEAAEAAEGAGVGDELVASSEPVVAEEEDTKKHGKKHGRASDRDVA